MVELAGDASFLSDVHATKALADRKTTPDAFGLVGNRGVIQMAVPRTKRSEKWNRGSESLQHDGAEFYNLIVKNHNKHIGAVFFAAVVGFVAFAPCSGGVVGIVGGIALAVLALFMVNSNPQQDS